MTSFISNRGEGSEEHAKAAMKSSLSNRGNVFSSHGGAEGLLHLDVSGELLFSEVDEHINTKRHINIMKSTPHCV